MINKFIFCNIIRNNMNRYDFQAILNILIQLNIHSLNDSISIESIEREVNYNKEMILQIMKLIELIQNYTPIIKDEKISNYALFYSSLSAEDMIISNMFRNKIFGSTYIAKKHLKLVNKSLLHKLVLDEYICQKRRKYSLTKKGCYRAQKIIMSISSAIMNYNDYFDLKKNIKI